MRASASEYELVSPGSLAGVLALMAAGVWTPMAGGTELMVQFGAGRLRARRLVNIFGLAELGGIWVATGAIRIGAGVTYTELRQSPLIQSELPLLARAASWTGAIANQNRGTLGGNLVNGSPAADTPPALLAYEAELVLVSERGGERRVPYREFHTGYKQTVLRADELVLAVEVPRARRTHWYLRKVGARNAQAISKVALGAVARCVEGRVEEVRLGLASVAAAPFRCLRTEAVLTGARLGPGLIGEARAALDGEIAPFDDIRSTARYRRQVAGNLLEEFLWQLMTAEDPLDRQALGLWNGLDAAQAEERLLACCGSKRWAAEVGRRRPFADDAGLMTVAGEVWFALDEEDWLEAFACHPRIGERKAAATESLASSEREQALAQETLSAVSERLRAGNQLFEERFGFRYIVFASGRTAPELLAVLEERLTHTRAEELHEASRQQHRITLRRMQEWLETL